MLVLIRFWRSLAKKDSVKNLVLDMKYNFFSTFALVLGRFFHGSGSGFFRIVCGFLADPDSEKKSDPDPGKKTGSEALVISTFFDFCSDFPELFEG